jgi:amino acid transporter
LYLNGKETDFMYGYGHNWGMMGGGFGGLGGFNMHVIDMKNPSRGFPLAIGLAAIVSLLLYAVGAVPVAGILAYQKISLQSGVFDAFGAVIGDVWHMAWLVRGLLATAHDGELPQVLHKTNSNDMPTNILLLQGAVVTIMSSIYFVIKDVSVVFFLVSAMTVALYLIAYMLMYAAAVRLRYVKPNLARPFKVPGGLAGMWVAAGVGFVGVFFSFLVAFFPPAQLPVGSPVLYVTLVIVGTVVFCGVPLILHAMRRPNWAKGSPALVPAE